MYLSKFYIQKLQDLPVEAVAGKLNISIRNKKALCPFHEDSRPSLTFNRTRNRYRCYVCDAHGGSIDLVMNSQRWTFYESCLWLAKEFGVTLSNEGSNFQPREVKKQKAAPVKIVEETKPDVAYLTRLMAQPVLNAEACRFLFEERKLSRNVVSKLGLSSISYACPMSSSPRPVYYDGPALLIPYRDIDGNLISVQSRYLGVEDKPRFRFPKGSTCHVFNLPVLKELRNNEPLFITEGVSDSLAILSAGFKAIAIPSATLLKESDVRLLQGLNLQMYPDQDEPGEKLYFQLKELCPQLRRHNLPAGFKDVGQYWAFLHQND